MEGVEGFVVWDTVRHEDDMESGPSACPKCREREIFTVVAQCEQPVCRVQDGERRVRFRVQDKTHNITAVDLSDNALDNSGGSAL